MAWVLYGKRGQKILDYPVVNMLDLTGSMRLSLSCAEY